jgi:hypothetical protein
VDWPQAKSSWVFTKICIFSFFCNFLQFWHLKHIFLKKNNISRIMQLPSNMKKYYGKFFCYFIFWLNYGQVQNVIALDLSYQCPIIFFQVVVKQLLNLQHIVEIITRHICICYYYYYYFLATLSWQFWIILVIMIIRSKWDLNLYHLTATSHGEKKCHHKIDKHTYIFNFAHYNLII